MRINAHLNEEQLLQYADGELSARQARQVRRHIEACWQCRAALDELQSLVSECVRYRKNVLHHFLPPPPARWGDIYKGFAEIDASQEAVPHFVSLKNFFRPSWRWVPVAAAAAALLVMVPYLRDTSSAQASELLAKAVQQDDTRPAKTARRIRIRTAKVDFIRSSTAAATDLQPMFVNANFNYRDPLRAKTFQDWREHVSDRQDDLQSDANAYRLRTRSATNAISDATLTLRKQDLRPVQEHLEFRNREWVEISDAGDEPSLPSEMPSTASVAPKSSETAQAPEKPQATKAEELRVLAMLHGIGADLGDPIDVTASGSKVEVSGIGLSSQRQQQIRETLRPLPDVVVHFSDAAPNSLKDESSSAPVTSGTVLPGRFQAALERQVGGRQRFEQFSSEVLDLSESMMSRAYAIRKLAQRFPTEAESQLPSEDRELLRKLDREHAAALNDRISQLQSKVTTVLAPMGAAATPTYFQAPGSWQGGAEAVFRAARRTETLLAALVGVTPDAADNPRLPSDVLSSIAELRAAAAAYNRLTLENSASK